MLKDQTMRVAEDFLKNFPGYEIVGISIPKLEEEYLFYNCITGNWILSQRWKEGIEYNACQIIVKKKYIFLTQSELFEKFANQIMQFKRREAYLMQYKVADKPIVMENPNFNNYGLIYNFIESIDESGKVTFGKLEYKLKK